jgi:hypothetical protein
VAVLLAQNRVAGGMSELIVDVLEVIETDEELGRTTFKVGNVIRQ